MKRNFNLLELVVVTVIISTLACILLPRSSEVRESGKQAVCLSNNKQVGIALTSFASQNNN